MEEQMKETQHKSYSAPREFHRSYSNINTAGKIPLEQRVPTAMPHALRLQSRVPPQCWCLLPSLTTYPGPSQAERLSWGPSPLPGLSMHS